MELNEVQFGAQPPVDGYGPGFFRVGGKVIEGSVLILPEGIYLWSGLGTWEDVIAQKDQIEFLLIGMGVDIAPLPKADKATLAASGINTEVMGSAAAARTYNVLLSEDRRVGVALLSV